MSLRSVSSSSLIIAAVAASATLFISATGRYAIANETTETHKGAEAAKHEAKEGQGDTHHEANANLNPAKQYDGRTPIDVSNGRFGNNGTYGKSNPEYEAKAKADLSAPGMFAASYSYADKDAFLAALKNRLHFFDEAMINLKARTEITKPETAKFADDTMAKLDSLFKQARDAEKAAKSAGEKEWVSAEANAHSSYVALKKAYENIMHPVND